MFEINNNPDFFTRYLKTLPSKYTENCFSSFLYYLVTQLKKSNPNIVFNNAELEKVRENTLISNTNAMKYLFDCFNTIDKIYPHHIQQTAFLINEPEGFSYGYRKTAVEINREVSFKPALAREIPSKMMSLLDSYHNIWNFRDPFEREALLHIGIVKIQPFEDGNKRTAQLVTGFNLLKSGYAPMLISQQDKDRYIQYIDEDDVIGFAKFMKENSNLELEHIMELYNEYDGEKENQTEIMTI